MDTKETLARGKRLLPALSVLAWIISLLAGCTAPSPRPAALTPLAEGALPTVIALTVQAAQAEASNIQVGTPEATSSPGGGGPTEPTISQTAQYLEVTAEAAGALSSTTTLSATAMISETTTPGLAAPQSEAATPSEAAPLSEAVTPSEAAPSPTLSIAPVDEAIKIYSPGPASKVVSPLQIKADVRAGIGEQVRMEIVGEDGRILTREIKVIRGTYKAGYASLQKDLEFEISSPAEEGRLKISVDDASGRTVALNSVPLVLLSYGYADILTPLYFSNPIQIQQPGLRALVEGGKLIVSGVARIEKGQPLMTRLIGPDGKELGARLAGLSPAGEGDLRSFTTEIPYKVSEPTKALLVVWAAGDSYQDILYLVSTDVLLAP